MKEYQKAYLREKGIRKQIQYESNLIVNSLKDEVAKLKSELNFISEIKKNTNEIDFDTLESLNVNPIFCLDKEHNLKFANRVGIELIQGFGFGIGDKFPFINKQSGNYDEKIYFRKYIYQTHVESYESLKYIFCSDISAFDDTSYLLKKAEKSYQNLFNSVNDVIFKINQKGEFLLINEKAVQLTGFSREELLNMTFIDLLSPDNKNKVIAHYEILINAKIAQNYYEFEILNRSGDKISLGQNVTITYKSNSELEVIAIARDITEIKSAENELRRSEEKYKNTLENLHFGLLEVDLDEEITKVYDGFLELTGYSEKDLLGRKPVEILLKEDSILLMKEQVEKRKTGESSVYEIEIKCKNDECKWVLISGTPIFDKSNRMIGSLGIHVDITERKKLEAELIEAEKKAVENARSKEIFLAKMSHELRTPLNAILGFSQILNEIPEVEKYKNEITTINKSATHLLEIVNDLLDLTKLNNQKLKFESIPFSIDKVLIETLNLFEVQFRNVSVELKSYIDLDDDLFVLGDPTRLRQVVTNLLSNALKFTEKGFVLLIAKTVTLDDKLYCEIIIEDTGIGMDPDGISELLEDFEQVESEVSRKYGGTGLGLSIVKHLVYGMGGNLDIQSELDKGTKVKVSFEFPFCKEEIISDENIKSEFEHLPKNCKILIVDDNKYNVDLAEALLRSMNVDYKSCYSGKEAISCYNNSYTHILMDVQMPDMNGIEASEVIKSNFPEAYIVAVTAGLISEQNLDMGVFDEVLSKPYTKESLLSKIVSKDEIDLYDLSVLDQMFDGDDVVIDSLINTFCETIPDNILIIEKALEVDDASILKSTMHKISPSLQHMGVQKGLELSRYIHGNIVLGESIGSKIRDLSHDLVAVLDKVVLKLKDTK